MFFFVALFGMEFPGTPQNADGLLPFAPPPSVGNCWWSLWGAFFDFLDFKFRSNSSFSARIWIWDFSTKTSGAWLQFVSEFELENFRILTNWWKPKNSWKKQKFLKKAKILEKRKNSWKTQTFESVLKNGVKIFGFGRIFDFSRFFF